MQYCCVAPSALRGAPPRWGAKNVLPLNLIALPNGEGLGGATLRVNLYKGRCPIKNHFRPFLWKGQTSEARRGWYPRVSASRANLRPFGADRVTMAGRIDDRISIRHFNLPASTSPLMYWWTWSIGVSGRMGARSVEPRPWFFILPSKSYSVMERVCTFLFGTSMRT